MVCAVLCQYHWLKNDTSNDVQFGMLGDKKKNKKANSTQVTQPKLGCSDGLEGGSDWTTSEIITLERKRTSNPLKLSLRRTH